MSKRLEPIPVACSAKPLAEREGPTEALARLNLRATRKRNPLWAARTILIFDITISAMRQFESSHVSALAVRSLPNPVPGVSWRWGQWSLVRCRAWRDSTARSRMPRSTTETQRRPARDATRHGDRSRANPSDATTSQPAPGPPLRISEPPMPGAAHSSSRHTRITEHRQKPGR